MLGNPLEWAADEITATQILINAYTALTGEEIDEDTADCLAEETEIKQAIGWAVDKVITAESMAAAIKLRIANLEARAKRFENHGKLMRVAIRDAMQKTGLPKLTLEEATVSVGKGRQFVEIMEETLIPSQYWKEVTTRTVMKDAIKAAIDAKTGVPGAALSLSAPTLTIRTK